MVGREQENKLCGKVPLKNSGESNRWACSEEPPRLVQVFSDHAMQIAGNKALSWWEEKWTKNWTITPALPIQCIYDLSKASWASVFPNVQEER